MDIMELHGQENTYGTPIHIPYNFQKSLLKKCNT